MLRVFSSILVGTIIGGVYGAATWAESISGINLGGTIIMSAGVGAMLGVGIGFLSLLIGKPFER